MVASMPLVAAQVRNEADTSQVAAAALRYPTKKDIGVSP
jgi:hypothetical protein